MADQPDTTSPPEIRHLTGSSSPTGSAPAFTPIGVVAEAAAVPPRLSAFPSTSWLDDCGETCFDAGTHPEACLIEACAAVQDLIEREDNLWKSLDDDDVADDNIAVIEAKRVSQELRDATERLADMPARTPEGLGAKSSILRSILGEQSLSFGIIVTEHPELLSSILDDASWIGTNSRFTIARLTGMEPGPPVHAPAEGWAFHHLVADWAQAQMETDYFFKMAISIEEKLRDIPERLFAQPEDKAFFPSAVMLSEVINRAWFGHPRTIAALREKQSNPSPRNTADPRGRVARIEEILSVYDAWDAEGNMASDSRRVHQFFDASNLKGEEADRLAKRVLGTPVSSISGLLAKAQVYACGYVDNWAALAGTERDVAQARSSTLSIYSRSDLIMRDLLRMLITCNISVSSLAAEPETKRKPDQRALYAYAEWLHFECKLLNIELYGRDAGRLVQMNTAAGDYHFPSSGGLRRDPPSTRAEHALAVLGIDWRKDVPVEAPVARSANERRSA